MLLGNALLQVNQHQHRPLPPPFASHRRFLLLNPTLTAKTNYIPICCKTFFNSLLEACFGARAFLDDDAPFARAPVY
jgi:hypothetical protein